MKLLWSESRTARKEVQRKSMNAATSKEENDWEAENLCVCSWTNQNHFPGITIKTFLSEP